MRILASCLISCFLLATCSLLFALPVAAQDRPFQQGHTIEIEVECIEAAADIIRELNGYNLESNMFLHEPVGWSPQRRATFVRRVDAWAFRQVQEELRAMGDVLSESENAVFLGPMIMDTEARLAAISQEIDRLTVMMAASDNLQVLIAIESRLSQVTWERNGLVGRHNVLMAQAASPVINIWLVETPGDRPVPVPLGFGRRIADRFSNSWSSTLSAAAGFLVFLIRVSMPVLAFGGVIAAVAAVIYTVRKRINREIEVPDNGQVGGKS